MKKLKPNQPITIVMFNKTWRAKTMRGGRGRIYFRVVETHTQMRGTLSPGTENVEWCRGWDTSEAKALRAATALL